MYSWPNDLKKYEDNCVQNPVKNKNKKQKQNHQFYEPKKYQKQRILLSYDIEKHPLGG